MPDLLETLLAALNPPADSPSYAGAPVPSEGAAMPGGNLSRFAPPPSMAQAGGGGAPTSVPGVSIGPAMPGNPVLQKLSEALGGGGQAPAAASPAAPPPSVAGPRVPANTPPPNNGGDAIVQMIRNISQGAAGVRPGSGKLSAVAQGAAGTLTSAYNEDERAKMIKAQNSRQAFEDMLKVRKDSRDETSSGVLNDLRAARTQTALQAPGGQGGVSGFKYRMYLAANPGDEQGALEYMGGRKRMSPAEMEKAARRFALEESKNSSSPAEQGKIDQRVKDIMKQMQGVNDAAAPASSAPASATPAAVAPSKPGDTRSYQGKTYRFKGGENTKNNWEVVP